MKILNKFYITNIDMESCLLEALVGLNIEFPIRSV